MIPTRSPRAQRHGDQIGLALPERDAHHIVELVSAWGAGHDAHRHERFETEDTLRFDGFDRARSVARR